MDPAPGRRHRLGPQAIGQRVVVRRRLPGQTGPSGGPLHTDHLGDLVAWGEAATIRSEDGLLIDIPVADIVSGKPVPPRPSPRLRVPAEVVQRRTLAALPATHTATLGEWLLRADSRPKGRVTSVFAVGDPGLPGPAAVARVVEWYAAQGLPPLASVVVGSAAQGIFEAEGWVPARPPAADVQVRLASVAAVRRTLGVQPEPAGLTVHQERPHWTASVTSAGLEIAHGRVTVDEDWAGLSEIRVDPAHRRRGLARALIACLLEIAAERGAATAWLQVPSDNEAGVALYDGLGFVWHHSYRYLRPPG